LLSARAALTILICRIEDVRRPHTYAADSMLTHGQPMPQSSCIASLHSEGNQIADTLERSWSVHNVYFLPVDDCRGLIPWSVSANRAGANFLVVADFSDPVPMRNAVQLHVNHARALVRQGLLYPGSRDQLGRRSCAGRPYLRFSASIISLRLR